jgi:hypothetical protein
VGSEVYRCDVSCWMPVLETGYGLQHLRRDGRSQPLAEADRIYGQDAPTILRDFTLNAGVDSLMLSFFIPLISARAGNPVTNNLVAQVHAQIDRRAGH